MQRWSVTNRITSPLFLPCLPTPHSLSNRCEKSKQSSLPMDGYHGFNTGLLLQCIKHTVYFIACRSGEYAGRVANVTCLVLKMYFRNVLGSVNFLCLQGNEHAQEKCYGDKSFHTIVFVEAKIGKITSMDVFPYKFLYALRIFLRIIPVRHGVCRPGYNPQLFRFALGLVQGIDHPSGHVCIRISMYE